MIKKEYITIPNGVTALRLVAAIILIFIEPLSLPYLIIYTIGGISDAIDGFLARKLGGETEFGAKLDSVSDISFYAVSLIKLMPMLYEQLPWNIWYFAGGVILLRIIMYIVNALIQKELLASHTYLNKAQSLMLFGLAYFVGRKFLMPYAWMLVGVAALAAAYEFTYNLYHKFFKGKICQRKK